MRGHVEVVTSDIVQQKELREQIILYIKINCQPCLQCIVVLNSHFLIAAGRNGIILIEIRFETVKYEYSYGSLG
jgi:hypothetical protein